MRRRSQTEPDSLRVQRELPCAHPSRVHTAAPDRESPKDRAPFLQSPAVKSNRLSRQFPQTTSAHCAVAVQCFRQPCAADAAIRQHRRAARAFRFAPVPAQSARHLAPKRAGNRIPKYRKPDCSFAKGQFYHLRSVPPASAGGSKAQLARWLLDPSAHTDGTDIMLLALPAPCFWLIFVNFSNGKERQSVNAHDNHNSCLRRRHRSGNHGSHASCFERSRRQTGHSENRNRRESISG